VTGAPSTSLGTPADAVNDPPDESTDGQPALLGAAATLPVERRRRPSRRERWAARRDRRAAARARVGGRHGAPDGGSGHSGVEYVFEAGVATTTPLVPYVKEVWERRRFMLELARAGVRGKQASTILGRLWGVIDPLFQALLYYLLFTIIRRGGRPIEFLPILIAGFFLFGLASSALGEGGRSIRGAKGIMLNSTFPRAVFPITSVYAAVMRFIPAVFVLAAFHIALAAPTGPQLLLLPGLFAIQLVMMLGLALLVSTIVALYADAGNTIQYITRILFFTTPVIFPLAAIPDGIRDVLFWQPFFALFASYQEIFGGDVPGLGQMALAVFWAVFFLVVGTRYFLHHERELAMRL
jgi:teichoic acid transport system permease protein